jgi:hypothetical protein
MSSRRKPAPVKVIHADGSVEVRAQASFPKRRPVAHGSSRRARAKRLAARNQRALEVSIARDRAAQAQGGYWPASLRDEPMPPS